MFRSLSAPTGRQQPAPAAACMAKYEGTWYNENGSIMVIRRAEDGQLEGKYMSSKGELSGVYTLAGRYDPSGPTLGLTVAWENGTRKLKSTTCWCGLYRNRTLETTWLLTKEPVPGEEWKATVVGTDYFTRVKPSHDILQKALKSADISHPRNAFH